MKLAVPRSPRGRNGIAVLPRVPVSFVPEPIEERGLQAAGVTAADESIRPGRQYPMVLNHLESL